jgi:beta-glucosidase
MTSEEKFWQLFMIPGDLSDGSDKYKKGIFGFQVNAKGSKDATGQLLNYSAATNAKETATLINNIQKFFVEHTRLGIPIIAFDESLHGLVRDGATVFPQSIALAASWDTLMMHKVANAIAHETKSRGIRQILSPVVNIAADPRWGRVEETYGEDPFLSSAMGVAFVSAFEKMGVVTTPKHFLANSGDGGRDSYPIDMDERLMEEIYLPPFLACFQKGGSRSVMTAYNSLDGSPCTANDWLLNKKLKQQYHFKGFVISDANAVGGANVLHYTASDYPEAAANAINNGLDVIFQTAYDHHTLFMPPFLDGRINKKAMDDAVKRVLTIKFELGLFENPYVNEEEVEKWNATPAHKAIAKEAAQKAIVLLKNENNTLPLSSSLKSLAVIGTDAAEARLGGYSGPGNYKVSILDALKARFNGVGITYIPGCGRNTSEYNTVAADYLSTTADNKTITGLTGAYFNNIALSGKPVITRIDKTIDFGWTLFSPDPSINFDFYSVRWTGKLHAPAAGKYKIGIEGNDGYRLYLDGKLIIDDWKGTGFGTSMTEYNFEKGKDYDINIEFHEAQGYAKFKLVWNIGITDNNWQQKIADAVQAANNAEAVVVVAGIEEGEFSDRSYLGLPGHQKEMIQQIANTGKPVVVVLIGGSAITMRNWMDKVPAIVDAWYPGEQGGYAVTDILFGDYNPAGRLPISFPVFEGQLPFVYNHKPTGRTDDYNNLTGMPLYPFGFGLSYSNFEYSDLHFTKKEFAKKDSVLVSFSITNTSKRDGEEVVQLYIRDLLSTVAQPVKQLKGFQRVFVKAGEKKTLSFSITPDLLKMLNREMKWVVEPGAFRIMIGASSSDIKLRDIITVRN